MQVCVNESKNSGGISSSTGKEVSCPAPTNVNLNAKKLFFQVLNS